MAKKTLSERFNEKVDRSGGPDACWPWKAYRNANGYGMIGVGMTSDRAHRVAWAEVNGPIPSGMQVLHICDNPPCCNPKHLRIGTPADNVADMKAKGRNARLNNHPCARLGPHVPEIRRMLAAGARHQDIADRFGTTTSRISEINTGKAWPAAEKGTP